MTEQDEWTQQPEQVGQVETAAPQIDETDPAEERMAEELAEVETATAEVLAGIVGDEFGLEMISPWGDRWIWVKVDGEQAQEIYKMLGDPVAFQRVGTGPTQHGEAGALGGELDAD